jgi:hypothetical protein
MFRTAKIARRIWRPAAIAALVLLHGVPAHAQAASKTTTVTDVTDSVLSATIPFATLTPGTSTTPSTTQLVFRLRNKSQSGYSVQASATFSANPTSPASGGDSLTAADIGIGITSIALASNVITPRTDAIASGFGYDPGTVTATNGFTPFTGRASGQATLADLIASPQLTLLTGPRIGRSDNYIGNDYLSVTITLGVLGQFLTPCAISGTLTLRILDNP